MDSVFDRELLVVSGKGGVGKTTIAAALGLLASARGLRTIIIEVGEQNRLCELFDIPIEEPGSEAELQENLWSLSIDPDRALLEWLQSLGGRVSGRVLASSGTFQYFTAAAPGARELVTMVKIWELTQRKHTRGRRRRYDLVLLDAPATGHALGMLDSPRTFGAIARVGPIAAQAERLRQLLEDPARSDYLAVAHGSELAVTETLELQQRLTEQMGRSLRSVFVNSVLPQRFSPDELDRLSAIGRRDTSPAHSSASDQGSKRSAPLIRSATSAAQAVSDRARSQQNQIARLRRRGFDVTGVPFQFSAGLDLDAIRRIAGHLDRRL
ncbi:MAG TPA: ArsA-related P-loop ATPase [Solirubrobacteraceae bacterium]|jgi:anion-transporting  ArsA/GET3 family ATPase